MTVQIELAMMLTVTVSLIVYAITRNRYTMRNGLMSKDGIAIPSSALFRVVYTDKVRTVLEQQSSQKETWTVSTEVFIGKPIRPNDIVRQVREITEMKALGIEVPQPFDVFVKDIKHEELEVLA